MIARLLLANLLELGVGAGVVLAFELPPATAYLVGLAVVGILSAHLALVHVSFGWTALAVTAALSLGFGGWRRGRLTLPRVARPGPIAAVGTLALVALLVRAWPTFAAKPLDDYDGWAMWGMKAKALTELGWADPALFASKGAVELHLDYPLLVPSLDAVASRAMGGFDPRLIHLQFLLVAVAGIAALAGLLCARVPAWLLWPWLLALAAAPGFLTQLLTAYADVPLALFIAAAVVAGALWVEHDRPELLGLAALFLAAGSLTKNEGSIFAVAALAGLLLATRRLRPVVLAACGFEALLLPWQVWLRIHHVHSDTLLGLQLFRVHHPGIAPLALRGLLDFAVSWQSWPLLLPLFVVAVVTATGSRVAVYAWTFAGLSLAGLTWIYVVSTQEWSNYLSFSGGRVVDSLILGVTALTPLLAAEGVRAGTERKKGLPGRA